MAPDHQRTQEQSIKARKHQLFEADEPVRSETDGPRQSFQDCLRTTPAEPLSTPIKALLWVMGTVVILLLIIALATSGPRKPKPKPVSGFVPQQQSGFVLASHNGFVSQRNNGFVLASHNGFVSQRNNGFVLASHNGFVSSKSVPDEPFARAKPNPKVAWRNRGMSCYGESRDV